MTNPLPSSAKAAAMEIAKEMPLTLHGIAWIDGVILRHVEPIVRELESNCDQMAEDHTELCKELLKAEQARDTALSRLAQSDALLREARSGVEAIAQRHEARSRGDDRAEQQAEKWRCLIRDIDSHLATATTKEGK